MEFPITVNSVEFEEADPLRPKLLFGGACGDMVAVRPCADEFEGKTFLGVLLGEMPLTVGVAFNKETGSLHVRRQLYNPAIFIPERNAVVFGCGSWWGKIKNESQLRQITDNDIQNVWYVKALEQLVPAETVPTSEGERDAETQG